MELREITEQLCANCAESQKRYQKTLIPGSKPCMGVKVPVLREIAKKIAKEGPVPFLQEYEEDYLEQEQLKAMVIGYAKWEREELLRQAEWFVPKIHDWSVCDTFCQGIKQSRKYREEVFLWLEELAERQEEYPQRAVAVILMSHFLVDDWYKKIYPMLERLRYPGHYTKMGVAWCLATAYAKYPQATMEYLKNNTLDDWTYNRAIQKMLESYRITEADKRILREMKRK